jgi:hypothetical protein
MTRKLILATVSGFALMFAAPVAKAAVISIHDATEAVSLQVAAPFQITSPGDVAPGTGNIVNLSSPASLAANNIASASLVGETLSFTFINQVNWGSDVYLYRRFTEPASEGFGGVSDLFVIQGRAGTTPDLVTFVSDETGTLGDLTEADILSLVPNLTGPRLPI